MRLVVEVGVLLLVLGGVVSGHQVTTAFHARAAHRISADPFAGLSGAEADTEAEPDVAVDPNDPDIVVAVFQQERFDQSGGCVVPGFATSRDGGLTWIAGSLPGLTVATNGPFDRASDPAVAIGADGAVYAQTLPFDVRDCRRALAVQRSDDHGLSFDAPVLVQDDSSCAVFNDKSWIAVDTFPASPHYGRVYSVWDRIDSDGLNDIVMSISTDGGASWGPLGLVNAIAPRKPRDRFTPGVAAYGGAVLVVYGALKDVGPRVDMRYVASVDGGVTFGRERRLG